MISTTQAAPGSGLALVRMSGGAAAPSGRIVSENDAPAVEGGALAFADDGAFLRISGCKPSDRAVAVLVNRVADRSLDNRDARSPDIEAETGAVAGGGGERPALLAKSKQAAR